MKNRSKLTLLILSLLLIAGCKSEAPIVDAGQFLSKHSTELDIREALKHCRKVGAGKLVFPKGTYHFYPDLATEEYLFISNNDPSLKRFVFDLSGMSNFEVDGNGSEFIFHGFLSPFLIKDAKNIVIQNFSVDYERTFHSEGLIEEAYQDSIDVYFGEAYPYKIDNNVLIFTDKEGTVYPWSSLLEFDPQRRETAYKVVDHWCGPYTKAKEIGERKVRVHYPGLTATKGNVMAFSTAHRLVPVFNVTNSENLRFFNLDLYHGGGMGIIAQMSRDIHVDNVRVTPRPGSGRVISITCDATHFVNCSGYIHLTNCLFENQKDDATNIHGLYARISEIVSDNEILVQMVHPQQYGVDFIFANEKMEFVNSQSLETYANNTVLSTERINEEYTRVTFKHPLPNKIKLGDGIAVVNTQPNVYIANCVIRGNRARGILLGSRGRIVIENNYFHTPGAAILLEGDCRFWYEQAGVRDLIVRNNTFDNCFYGTWGNAVIQVGSGIEESQKEISRYNRNILIENNIFNIFTPEILNVYSVDRLIFRNNTINRTQEYPWDGKQSDSFIVGHSSGVEISDNFKF